MKPKLLIVEDDQDIRSQMKWSLASDYEIFLAEDRPSAMEIVRLERPMVVLLDFGLPPNPADTTEGGAALSEILLYDRACKVVVLTGQTEKENAIHAIGEGAYDFVCKPAEIDELKIILKRAFQIASLEKEIYQMQKQAGPDSFEGMIGASPPMLAVFDTIRKVASTDASILILGESGTGKEVVASAIHRRSMRKDGLFVPINCGAIPAPLLESELFGHEKGAFTGAHVQRKGRIETANKGTLFLDEIGDLPALLQVKLLRFLQERRIERVGGRQEIPIDSRVLAATNVDLPTALKNEKFREDLYYRIAVVTIAMPPLKERGNDVLLLAKSFLQRFAAQNQKETPRLSQQAVRALTQHQWPGNVRELENRIKRAVIMADSPKISPSDLGLGDAVGDLRGTNLKEAREGVERELIQQVLRKHRGKISPAALELGISRPTFYDLMEKFDIKRNEGASIE